MSNSSSTSTTARGTATKTSEGSGTTSTAQCTWLGHCLGDHCSNENDCDQNWECHSSVCVETCTWIGHCLGDSCDNYNDCDSAWVCNNNKVCAICDNCGGSSTSPTSRATSQSTSRIVQTLSLATSTSPPPSATASSHDSLSTGAVIGLGVAIPVCIISIALVGFLVWWRRRKRRRELETTTYGAGHGRRELDSTGAEKRIPIELGADQAPAELDEEDVGKHKYHAPEVELDPVEIDGQERQPSAYTHEMKDQRAQHLNPEMADPRPFESLGLTEHHALATPTSTTISSPSWPSLPQSPGPTIGYAVSSPSEADLMGSPASETAKRRKLQRKRGSDPTTYF